MKKLIVIAIAALSFSAASAQNRNDQYRKQDDRYQVNQQQDNRYHNDHQQANDRGYGRNDDRNRQAEYDRMNRQYDQRINDYRNDRSLNRFERDRRIRQAEQERQQKRNSFGTGLVVGGIAGLILGAVIAH